MRVRTSARWRKAYEQWDGFGPVNLDTRSVATWKVTIRHNSKRYQNRIFRFISPWTYKPKPCRRFWCNGYAPRRRAKG